MKKLLSILVTVLLSTPAYAADNYTIDPNHT